MIYFCFSTSAISAESLSYSGRLVNTNGSPVAGPVNLKVELSYTNAPTTVLCSQIQNGVVLTNGVFHLKIDLNCGSDSLSEVLAAVPAGEAASLRVTDLSHSKTYSFQAMHAVPFSNISEYAKNLVIQGTADGQVLKWNDGAKKWEPGTITVSGGTVTNVSANAPLTISNPTSTPTITLSQANNTTNGYLSSTDWNTFNNKQPAITAGTNAQYYRGDKSWQTLDTSVVPENVANLYFTNARALGVPLSGFSVSSGAITASDTVLSAFEKTQGQLNSIGAAGNNYLLKNSSDSITGSVNVGVTGALTITNSPALPTDAVNKQYADTKLNLTGGTLTGDLNVDTQLKLKGATNYVTVKAHATTGTYNFVLPQTAGTNGYVLQTDGSGNTSWITPSINSSNIADGSIVDADINASAAIAQSKIANLTSDLSAINTSITGINSTISGLTTTSVVEGTNKYYLDSRAIAAPLTGFSTGTDTAIVATDTTLQAFDKTQGQLNNRVKKNGDTMTGILTLDSDLKIKGGSNYVTLRGHATSAAYNFIFPQTAGTSGYVLSTDGAGNTNWVSPSVGSSNITDGSIVDADVNASAAIAQSKIANLTTDLASKVSTTLSNGNILIGNGSNVATAVAVSGDATLSNTGALTLANTAVTAGTYSSVTVDGKGRVTGGTNPVVVTGVSVTAPITNSGTASVPLIGMPAATGAVDGYLTSANFTTFNNKQNAITAATDITTGSITTNKQNAVSLNPFGAGAGNTGEFRFYELTANGTNYTGFKAPNALAADVIYTLPAADGTSGQVLSTNASGVLSWTSIPTSLAPNGAAGGGLSGTYPNPTIASGLDAAKLSAGSVSNIEFDYLDGVTSSIQTQLNAKQASDATLSALAAYNTNGILVQTAADTFTGRSIVGTSNRVNITDGNGVAGNPTINIDTGLLPSPAGAGSWLKSTGVNTSAWTTLGSSDITGALGYTPINKAGDTISSGTFNFNVAALLRTLDPIGPTDVATKQYVDANDLWTKSGSDIYRSSNVGIGTATPGAPLEVNVNNSSTAFSTTQSSLNLKNTNATANSLNSIAFINKDGFTSGQIAALQNAGNVGSQIILATKVAGGGAWNALQFVLDPTGNIGIGTGTPSTKLDVNGVISNNAGNFKNYNGVNIAMSPVSDGTYSGYLLLAPAYTSGLVSDAEVQGRFTMSRGGPASGNRTDVLEVSSKSAYSTEYLLIHNFNSNSTFITGTFKVTYSGVVYHALGISISGGNADNGVIFDGKTIGVTPMIVRNDQVSGVTAYGNVGINALSNGNVGIGTIAPTAKLDVRGGQATVEQFPVKVFMGMAVQTASISAVGGTWTDLTGASVTVTLPRTMTVLMQANGSITPNGTGTTRSTHCGVRFVINGAPEGNANWGDVLVGASSSADQSNQAWWTPWSMRRMKSLAAGTYTIKLQMTGWNGTDASCLSDAQDYSRANLSLEGW